MSYSPPAGNAVTFTWTGALAYTAQSGDSIEISFDPTRFPAAGFQSGGFGLAAVVLTEQGFSTTTFGTPILRLVLAATGSEPSTTFGLARDSRLFTQAETTVTTQVPTPQAQFLQIAQLDSFGPTAQVPTPVGQQIWKASGIASTVRFPTPSRLFNQEVYPMSEPSTVFGVPAAEIGSGSALDVSAYAVTDNEFSAFGTPSVGSRTAQSTGSVDTQFGVGKALLGQNGTALSATSQIGSPKLLETQYASGVDTTTLGTPVMLRGVLATGFLTGGLGLPVGRRSATGVVTGFVSGAFGTASASARRGSATSVPPGVLFGTPQITRSLVC